MKKKNIIIYIIFLILIMGVMFFWIDKKQGFHTDEVFSYGTSNCDDSNVYQAYGGKDPDNEMFLDENPIKTIANVIYYNLHKTEFEQKYDEIKSTKSSVWRNKEEAIEYVTLDKDELFNYFVVYYNTGEDVHPPLFYFVVHFVSSLMLGHFSKYIIFFINLIFCIGTLIILRKILLVLKKEYLTLPVTIFYGFSLGAISTVMFQRMYMMLTFFTVYFLYINLKIYFRNFQLDKKLKIELCVITILGFLTQYYFCIFAALVAFFMLIFMIKEKNKKIVKEYIIQFVKSAIIGVIIFIPCIYHIFFSYRGVGGVESEFGFLEKLYATIKNIFISQFGSMNLGIMFSLLLVIMASFKYKVVSNKKIVLLLVVPVIIYIIIISKLIPYRSVRYIMNILPLISMIIIFMIDKIINNKKISLPILLLISISIVVIANFFSKPSYLYSEYEEYKKIALKNSECKFVFICDTVFNHLKNIEELMIYEESLMLLPENIDLLTNDEKLKNEDEFILSIQKWVRR